MIDDSDLLSQLLLLPLQLRDLLHVKRVLLLLLGCHRLIVHISLVDICHLSRVGKFDTIRHDRLLCCLVQSRCIVISTGGETTHNLWVLHRVWLLVHVLLVIRARFSRLHRLLRLSRLLRLCLPHFPSGTAASYLLLLLILGESRSGATSGLL